MNIWTLIAIVTLSLVSGCATVNFSYPKDESFAVTQTDDSYLGQQFVPIVNQHPHESGFKLQKDSINALGSRLFITQNAQHSIDAKYYLIKPDAIGFLIIGSLLQAADRGVRVRLLVDDFLTYGNDLSIAAFDSHPNIEVRIFNPFAGRKSRIGDALTNFRRINRRMHNKSFTVDNQVTIVGGRNIADEYFGARNDVNFSDLDVMAVGPIVREVSNMFDKFWNHKLAVPILALTNSSSNLDRELQRLRERLNNNYESITTGPYAEAVRKDFKRYFAKDSRDFLWSSYLLTYDSPDKALKYKPEDFQEIVTTLKSTIDDAKNELIIISPYFVPRKRGIQLIKELRDAGIEVTIITNSLASTNHPVVHSGYAPSRVPLLKLGVKIYETKKDVIVPGVTRMESDDTEGTLHTKAFIVDREKVFIGSFNWDPRSVNINTEMGVIIESDVLAEQMTNFIENNLDAATFKLYIDDNNRLRWADNSGDEPVLIKKEPNTNLWKRFKNRIMRILPIDSQL